MFTNRKLAAAAFGTIIGFAALLTTAPAYAVADYPWGKTNGSDTHYVADYPWGKGAPDMSADDYPWG